MIKCSVDYLFANCRNCPFVKPCGDFSDYYCRPGKFNVSGDGIPAECPLKKDEVGKIYTIRGTDIQ